MGKSFIALITCISLREGGRQPSVSQWAKWSSETLLPLALKCGTKISRKGERLQSHHA